MKDIKGVKIIFLKILGTVESSLGQLTTLICYSLPVRLTHHKADSALSICILLFFKISPSNLNKANNQGVALWAGNRWIFMNSCKAVTLFKVHCTIMVCFYLDFLKIFNVSVLPHLWRNTFKHDQSTAF